MALTPSTMMPLGTIAPDFSLFDTVSKTTLSLKELASQKGTVIVFTCNHCPFVIHIQEKLVEVANHYQAKGIRFIAICANDTQNYPQDGPDKMEQRAIECSYPFPYLYDETQNIAKAYNAACTPDFYLFDDRLACVYRGRFDDSTPGNGITTTGKDLSHALDELLAKRPIDENQKPSVGCNIKWKK